MLNTLEEICRELNFLKKELKEMNELGLPSPALIEGVSHYQDIINAELIPQLINSGGEVIIEKGELIILFPNEHANLKFNITNSKLHKEGVQPAQQKIIDSWCRLNY